MSDLQVISARRVLSRVAMVVKLLILAVSFVGVSAQANVQCFANPWRVGMSNDRLMASIENRQHMIICTVDGDTTMYGISHEGCKQIKDVLMAAQVLGRKVQYWLKDQYTCDGNADWKPWKTYADEGFYFLLV